MRVARLRCLLGVIAIGMAGCAAIQPEPQTRACAPPQGMRDGWNASFVAGCTDRNGRFVGGSQVIHLIPHKGSLYGAIGYWQDKHNAWYGGEGSSWAQVVRLIGADEPWSVDLELGPQHLRAELLKSVTFTQDAQGHRLPTPDTLLIAATFDGGGNGGVSVFVRNDGDDSWVKTKLISGETGKRGEDNSVRAAAVYRDRVTGQESLFISVGVLGVYTGRYDPSRPGKIRWAPKPEPGTATGTRILSIVEANDSLFFSEGTKIFRRIDGLAPRYELVADLSGEVHAGTTRAQFQSIGGIRGLSAIEGQVPGRQSLLFAWHAGKQSPGCIFRLDPQPDGSYARVRETCLADEISRHLDGAPTSFVLAAYSTFMPLRDPRSNELLHLIGLEAYIPATPGGRRSQHLTAHNQRSENGGMYAGGIYALRDARGRWRIGEVNGKYRPGQPELVSIYTYALAPFREVDRQTIYLGGYDPNHFPSTDTSWVFSTDLDNLVGR